MEQERKAECLGGECIYGKTVCCRDCEERISCNEICDGYEDAGCDSECKSRCERED